ncbi:MAG: BamA/TamA family outer membrane protein [Leptonema sp. (in: bacteria)]
MKQFYRINLILVLFFPIQILSQNKILSENSKNWEKLETKEMVIFFPKNYGFLALKSLTYGKKAIDFYSKVLQHNLSHQILVFLYPNFRDFQSSNIHAYMLPEGVAGYTEGYFERIVLPYNGDEEDLLYTLSHELVHSVQYDIMLNHLNTTSASIPLWFVEGMSEYLSIGTKDMDVFLRDLILSKRLPDLYEPINGYSNYKIGQSVMYFIHKKWSLMHIGILFKNILLTKDVSKAFYQTLQIDFFDFNLQWKEFLYERYKGDVNFKESKDRITFRYRDILRGQNPFHFKPKISPDGKTFVYFSYEKLYPVLVLRNLIAPTLSEEEIQIKNTLLYFLKDEFFEEWQPLTTKVNFDFTGDSIYFPTRTKSNLSIVRYNIKQKKIQKIYKLPFDTIFEPSITHRSNKEKIVFVATIRGFSDIYILDLISEDLKQITNNFEREKSPVFSLNNESIIYIKKISEKENAVVSHNIFQNQSSVIFSLKTEIESIQEGYLKINEQWLKGIFYTAKYNNKFSLFFYSYENHKHFLVTNNNRDIFSFDVFTDTSSQKISSSILYSTLEEGTYEIFYKDFSIQTEKFNQFYKNPVEEESPRPIEWKEKFLYLEEIQNCCESQSNLYLLNDHFSSYQPKFYRRGFPFIALTGSADSQGNTSLVFLGYASFADLQNNHVLEGFITYQENPVILNGEIQYSYKLNRMQYNTGIYSYNGVFAILNPLDLSLNYILYNPFQRLLSYSTSGIYGSAKYFLHNYSSFGLQIDLGREEQIFLPKLPEERKNDDIFKNHLTFRFYYLYDNAKYSLYGPLDGISFLVGYEIPIKTDIYDKEVYQTLLEFRYYELFKNYSLFAYRFFLGAQTGKDSKNFPYRIGGYSTIRGYDFQKFEGRYAFIMNLEYRFTFIEELLFGFPFRWSPGLIRGSMFMDMGAAFDDPKRFQAFDAEKKITKDLKASIGVGIHWNNFLWFIFPGAMMKIEWASPYDGKKTLPFSKWQSRFSIGFVF